MKDLTTFEKIGLLINNKLLRMMSYIQTEVIYVSTNSDFCPIKNLSLVVSL